MAIKSGHKFHAEHGFTGSAHPEKDFQPKMHGFKHGGMEHEEAKEHFGKKNHKDHDGENHMSHVHYDEHGFQKHAMGGMAKFKKGGEC